MLLNFKVGHFLSFEKIQKISMMPGKSDKHPDHIINHNNVKLLRSSFIYGPNSSGKSNFISAIYYSRNKILNLPIQYIKTDYKLTSPPIHKNSIGKTETKPSYFEYIIENEGKIYSYGFEINTELNIYMSEWLYLIENKKYTPIFTFDYKDDTLVFSTIDELNKISQKYASTDKKMTFLKFARKYHPTPDLQIYDWFEKNLMIRIPNSDIQILHMDDSQLEKVAEQLKQLDTSITGFELSEENEDELDRRNFISLNNNREQRSKKVNKIILKSHPEKKLNQFLLRDRCMNQCIFFDKGQLFKGGFKIKQDDEGTTHVARSMKILHNCNKCFKTELFEESEGTIRILKLICDLVATQEIIPLPEKIIRKNDIENHPTSRTLIVDEIECGMHTNTLIELIKRAHQICNIPLQIIATTHDSRLLSDNNLRTDEVWFMKSETKNDDKFSIIYSLEEYRNIDMNNSDEAYLNGIFGAVPLTYPEDE